MTSSTYDNWSREELIARLIEINQAQPKPRQPSSASKLINKAFPIHTKRKIALKFCYSGWEYGGLAYQNKGTQLPTVEGVLFEALAKARLIDPEAGFDGCGWEKCGRTDRGVSAAGQVVSLWVRSALGSGTSDDRNRTDSSPSINSSSSTSLPTKITKAEHDYLAILNRLLPLTIRILAWSPVSDSFSARFSCKHRHYKYFFSSDVIPGPPLDIDRMRLAASYLIGEHDFRNMCKIDPGKQITVFKRRVMRADIEPVSVNLEGLGMYVFNLIGSAFLYHQVRHIMAILFMVGSRLEDPSVVVALMNVEVGLEADQHANEHPVPLEIVDRKPEYQMADALPLVLWDCGYPTGELDWRTTSSESTSANANTTGLYQQLHSIYSRSQIYTTLNNYFLTAASVFHPPPPPIQPLGTPAQAIQRSPTTTAPRLFVPLGGGTYKRTGQDKYVPLLKRNRLDTVEVVNERWRLGKGFRRNERRKAMEETSENEGSE